MKKCRVSDEFSYDISRDTFYSSEKTFSDLGYEVKADFDLPVHGMVIKNEDNTTAVLVGFPNRDPESYKATINPNELIDPEHIRYIPRL